MRFGLALALPTAAFVTIMGAVSAGRVHLYRVSGQAMPRTEARYVLFLTGNDEQGFTVLTAYEFHGGKVFPLDNLPKPQLYKNVDQARFLDDLRTIKTH